MTRQNLSRPFVAAALAAGMAFLSLGAASALAQPPIVQPGAPGEPSRTISAAEASDLAGIRFTEADVMFMQGMISHHAQALEMTALLDTNTASDAMRATARRIELSQDDEIEMMQEWLRERGQEATAVDAHHAEGFQPMPGMLTAEEMASLADAEGAAFDRLFLELMIKHHRGAVTMVENLLRQPGAAQDSVLFGFTSDITADQTAEIDRMDAMMAELSPDPRVQLAAGFDAEQALWNMELVATRPMPEGFYDPNDPARRSMPVRPDPERGAEAAAAEGAEENEEAEGAEEEEAEEDDARDGPPRRGLLNFGNSDLAFAGDQVFVGSYHGFNTYRVEVPASPTLISSVVCPGGQGDVSVVGNLLIMSVEQTRGRLDCGPQGVAEPVSEQRFRGIRIFDISDMRMPRQVAAGADLPGVAHPHRGHRPRRRGATSTSTARAPAPSGRARRWRAARTSRRPRTPTARSSASTSSRSRWRTPRTRPWSTVRSCSAIPRRGEPGACGPAATTGPGTQRTAETNRCHDITAFPELGLAAGACSGNGILFDISDPVNPVRLDDVIDPSFAYWHSATFNHDGTKVLFTDEWGGGGRPRCRASDPREWGANAIYDIVDGRMEFRSHYKLPAPQTETENCVAHNGSLVPVPGRDIMAQAWYQGGISVFDFTDSANPVEIAFFDRGPMNAERQLRGGHWSAYWYRGYIYGSEIARGLDRPRAAAERVPHRERARRRRVHRARRLQRPAAAGHRVAGASGHRARLPRPARAQRHPRRRPPRGAVGPARPRGRRESRPGARGGADVGGGGARRRRGGGKWAHRAEAGRAGGDADGSCRAPALTCEG